MNKLLPDRLRELWGCVEAGQLTRAGAQEQQDRFLAEYRELWTHALTAPEEPRLKEALLSELAAYLGVPDVAALEARCRSAGTALRHQWERIVGELSERSAIERFYDESHDYLLDLMWWHTLVDDVSPLAYVLALDFARRCPGGKYLDFGSGVGSGAILFARHGYSVALADISSPLLDFSRWRLARRDLAADMIDLKTADLPPSAFDFITAMDVFEHLADPVETVDDLVAALRPGGYLFGRFAADPDPERPQHIVFEFDATFQRLCALGLKEVWRDSWLWGHQVFKKPSSEKEERKKFSS